MSTELGLRNVMFEVDDPVIARLDGTATASSVRSASTRTSGASRIRGPEGDLVAVAQQID
jgi:hypothetical protein